MKKRGMYIADGEATVTVKPDGELTTDAVTKINDIILSNTNMAVEKI